MNADLLTDLILKRTRAPGFAEYLANLATELCRIETTPSPDVRKMRNAENGCFRILERELSALGWEGARCERRPINPAISRHPAYSLLHFTKTPARPQGLSPRETYGGRSNLVFLAPGARRTRGGTALALNGHVDVVAPYFPPRRANGTLFGRGSCDDKGPVTAIVGALKALAGALDQAGAQLNQNLVGMFVVEEETGGNGSLSLAIDRDLRKWYDSVLVAECTNLKLHPANRGAVWYRGEIRPPRGVPAFELAAFIYEELENEGAAIRAESHHPLFPQRPVQTCHGIIGPFGEHPSRICGEVEFEIGFGATPGPAAEHLVSDCLASGLQSYIGLYGDKTKVIEPSTGKPMVAAHFELRRTRTGFKVAVYGATGHMGAIRERDGAITKMAHLVRALVRSRPRIEAAAGRRMTLQLSGHKAASLVIEGGQGFVPTHDITEVMARLQAAAARGAEGCLRRFGSRLSGRKVVTLTYEKLHNVAFDGDPDSPSVRNAMQAARTCQLPQEEPILGWTVSCDARLFAKEYPGMPVLTFGPGELRFAHSDQEQIEIEDIRRAAEFLALFVLKQVGVVPATK